MKIFTVYGDWGPVLGVANGFRRTEMPADQYGQFLDPIDAYRKDRILFEAWGSGQRVRVPLNREQALELMQHLSEAVEEYDKARLP